MHRKHIGGKFRWIKELDFCGFFSIGSYVPALHTTEETHCYKLNYVARRVAEHLWSRPGVAPAKPFHCYFQTCFLHDFTLNGFFDGLTGFNMSRGNPP